MKIEILNQIEDNLCAIDALFTLFTTLDAPVEGFALASVSEVYKELLLESIQSIQYLRNQFQESTE